MTISPGGTCCIGNSFRSLTQLTHRWFEKFQVQWTWVLNYDFFFRKGKNRNQWKSHCRLHQGQNRSITTLGVWPSHRQCPVHLLVEAQQAQQPLRPTAVQIKRVISESLGLELHHCHFIQACFTKAILLLAECAYFAYRKAKFTLRKALTSTIGRTVLC